MVDDDLIAILHGLRRVPSPEEVPLSTLTQWRIYRAYHCDVESDHFVGISGETALVRMSTDIVKFDAKSLAGVTRSGRMYRLQGPPATDEDFERAELAFARLACGYGTRDIRDVTDEFIVDPQHQRGIVH